MDLGVTGTIDDIARNVGGKIEILEKGLQRMKAYRSSEIMSTK